MAIPGFYVREGIRILHRTETNEQYKEAQPCAMERVDGSDNANFNEAADGRGVFLSNWRVSSAECDRG